jgi:hypothetical protein
LKGELVLAVDRKLIEYNLPLAEISDAWTARDDD